MFREHLRDLKEAVAQRSFEQWRYKWDIKRTLRAENRAVNALEAKGYDRVFMQFCKEHSVLSAKKNLVIRHMFMSAISEVKGEIEDEGDQLYERPGSVTRGHPHIDIERRVVDHIGNAYEEMRTHGERARSLYEEMEKDGFWKEKLNSLRAMTRDAYSRGSHMTVADTLYKLDRVFTEADFSQFARGEVSEETRQDLRSLVVNEIFDEESERSLKDEK